MKRFVLGIMACACWIISLCVPAQAQATRTWVSGVGDNFNPGSRTAPCLTFAGVLGKTAASGEIDCLDPGQFGTVTITKSITLDGGGSRGGIIAVGTSAIVVNAGPNDTVILRHLTLTGDSTGISGIQFVAGKRLIVEDCIIGGGFTMYGVDIAAASGKVVISNTIFDHCGTAGVHVAVTGTPTNVSISNVTITNCTTGVDLVSGAVDVSNSTISDNTSVGLLAEGGSLSNINNTLQGNGQDVRALAGAVVASFSNFVQLGLTLAFDTTTVAVATGQPATYRITITPPPGGFTQPVTFSCLGLPSNLAATFNPATLPAGTAPGTTTLTLTPVAASVGLPAGPSLPSLPGLPDAAGLLAIPFLGALALAAYPRRRLQFASLLPMGILLVVLGVSGCGGGGSSVGQLSTSSSSSTVTPATPATTPTPSTIPFTVRATSGTMTASQRFSLTFQ